MDNTKQSKMPHFCCGPVKTKKEKMQIYQTRLKTKKNNF